MPVAVLALLGALTSKMVDLVRQIRAKDWNAVLTQLVAWGAGVAGAFLLAASDFADKVTFDQLGGFALSDLNGASLTFVGMSVLSVFSKLVDAQKVFDNSQSAAVPPLLPEKPLTNRQLLSDPRFESGASTWVTSTDYTKFTLEPTPPPETANERQIKGRLDTDPGTINPPKAAAKKAAKTTKKATKKP